MAAWDTQDINKVELRRVAWFTGVCFVGQCCLLLFFVLMFITQGRYGTPAAVVSIIAGNVVTMMQIIYFGITALVDLDLKLQI